MPSLRSFFAGAVLMLAAASFAHAQAPSVASFFERTHLQQVDLSPSGRFVAMQSREGGKRAKLTVIDLEGKEPARVIAMFSKFDVAGFAWVDDDWLTFSVSDEFDRSGWGSGGGINAVRRDGEKMRPLIARGRQSEGSSSKAPLSQNHHIIANGPLGSNELIVGQASWDSDGDYSHSYLRVLNVATGDARSLFKGAQPPAKMSDWMFDAKGQPRLAWTDRANVTTYYWAEPDGAWRKIAAFPSLKNDFTPAFVDDKDQLYVAVADGPNGLSQLHKFDFKTGKPEAAVFFATPGFDTAAAPIQEHGSNKVHGLRLLTDSKATAWFTPAMAAVQARIDASLPGRVNTLSCRQCDAPRWVLIHSYSDKSPGEYLIYNKATDKLQELGPVRDGHKEDGMAEVSLLRTTTRDGADLPVWITATPTKIATPRLAIVLVHGGPWSRGGEWKWEGESQFLASRGYVVIKPEFRGSMGYGDQHYRAGWKQWGQRMQDDVSDALAFAVKSGLVDPKRVCIAGGSYGGYAALMGVARSNGQYQCAVAWVAVTDPSYMSTVYWNDFSDDTRKYSIPVMVGDPKKDAAMLDANSPLKLAQHIKVPVLLAYGGKDQRVPLVHGEEMRTALTDAGNPPQWLLYTEEGHGWSRTETRIDFWTKVGTFLDKNLK
jgi:dienelactone hydrolase